jgi:hypothetical protein
VVPHSFSADLDPAFQKNVKSDLSILLPNVFEGTGKVPGTGTGYQYIKCYFLKHIKHFYAVSSVVDSKLFVTDPDLDPDPTFQRVPDPDQTFKKVPDTVSDPTLNIYFFSRTVILRSFKSILKHNFRRKLKICIL